jgi:glutathione S-transferase
MRARLYGMSISHAANAARLMLEHKGIEYDLVKVQPGMQAAQVRLAGFRGGTVPALRIDGRRVVGTTAISRALDELAARAIVPVAAFYARREDARRTERVRRDWAELPEHLDRVDDSGTIGGPELNAADFQIGTTLRVMLASADYAPAMDGRPAAELARRVWPDYRFSLPSLVPAEFGPLPARVA